MKKSECEALISSKNHWIGNAVEIFRGRKIKTRIKGIVIKIYCECISEIDKEEKKEVCKAIAIIEQGGKHVRVSAEELP